MRSWQAGLNRLQGDGCIRVWDPGRMGFVWVDRQQAPWSYRINLLVSWPARVIVAVLLAQMPPR
jgi:hypothetical protein